MMEGTDLSAGAPSPVTCKLHVQGVSSLSTADVVALFPPCGKVEWIDDDSCNVVFIDDNQVIEWLNKGSALPEFPSIVYRRAVAEDRKKAGRTWRESEYYKNKLVDNGIDPKTLYRIATLKKAGEVDSMEVDTSGVMNEPTAERSAVNGGTSDTSKKEPVVLIPRTVYDRARRIVRGDIVKEKRPKEDNSLLTINVNKSRYVDDPIGQLIVDEDEKNRRAARMARFGGQKS